MYLHCWGKLHYLLLIYYVLFTENNIWCDFTQHGIIHYFHIIQTEKLRRSRCPLKIGVEKFKIKVEDITY